MLIERVKVEIEFKEVKEFEYFEYNGELYLKLPALTCTVPKYYGHARFTNVKGDFNSIGMTKEDYKYFEEDIKVRPLKSELKIYE